MRLVPLLAVVAGLFVTGSSVAADALTDSTLGRIRVGLLTYADNTTAECFSEAFLTETRRVTQINIDRSFWPVRLDNDGLYEYPFVVMGGTGQFELPEPQRQRLGAYLRRGGFLLASAGCSDAEWAASFSEVIEGLFGQGALRQMVLDHPVFRTVYEVDRLTTRQGGVPGEIYGLWIGGDDREGGRLAVIFSPTGLHDTANAGGGCCCCGGNEFLDAHRINTNVLVYTLTH